MLIAPAVQELSLLGRAADRAAVAALLEAAASCRGGALVLTASPGAGRTAFLRAVAASTTGWTVLSAPGHADESGLPYAGLQRLFAPLGETLPRTDELALAGVVVARLRATRRRILCLLDDAHLLDPASWRVLRLVARRLDGVSVVVLASVPATADGYQRAAGLPQRPLPLLGDDDGRHLLRALAPALADDVAAGLLGLAGGHPGVLVTLAGALTAEQQRGYAPPPVTLPPDSALLHHFRARLAELPADTRRVLLLAAAEPAPAPADLLAGPTSAALRTGATPAASSPAGSALAGPAIAGPALAGSALALEPAERAGLVTVTAEAVHFDPPLLRAVVWHDAPIAERHAVHRTLSGLFAARGEHLSALIHRAAATAGPDNELARDLLAAAAGAPPALAAAAQRYAAELGSTPSAAPLLAAARSAWAAGRPQETARLLRRATRAPATTEIRARSRALAAEAGLRDDPATAAAVLLDVAAELLPYDPRGAVDALLPAGEASCRTGVPGRFPHLARQAVALCSRGDPGSRGDPDGGGDPGSGGDRGGGADPGSRGGPGRREEPGGGSDLAVQHLAGLADLLTGAEDAAFSRFREVLRLAERATDPGRLTVAATAGILAGQDRRAAVLAGRAVAGARAAGAAALVPAALEIVVFAEMAAGRYDAATGAALDGVAVARRAGRTDLADAHVALLAVLAALVGDRATGLHRLGELRRADGDPHALGDWAVGLLDLVAGRPGAAAERLSAVVAPAGGRGSLLLRVAAAPHLVEAAAHARPAVLPDVFDRWAARTGEAAWLALRARCRALCTADDDAAEDYFREALRRHGPDETGFPQAHTELLYARHLRRRRRNLAARDHLRHAAETFRRLGAAPWAEQAAQDLRAAGERVTGPAVTPAATSAGALTAQQERIAGLVADGATNREVAQQLHLSPRTVDHHLRNVFARLGVRSRTELARLLSTAH